MSEIKSVFDPKALISFITAGDPCIEKTKEYILEMAKGGSDIIEIGIPFSDPVAEGPMIEKAHIRALHAGTTTDKVLDMVKGVRKETSIPIILVSYINPIFMYGIENFFKKCKSCHIHGILIPDLPFEEKKEVLTTANHYDVKVITMIAPASEDRMQRIAGEAQDFIYLVSPMDKGQIDSMIKKIGNHGDLPIILGCDVSQPEQAKDFLSIVDGVITGNEIAKIIDQYGDHAGRHISAHIKKMKESINNFI